MDVNSIIEIVTIVVTLILGIISKKSNFINSKKIPIQNLIIGIISFVIDYIITKDFNASIMFSGLLAGGTYDLLKNLKKISDDDELTFENDIEGVK